MAAMPNAGVRMTRVAPRRTALDGVRPLSPYVHLTVLEMLFAPKAL